jgi:hypothetical protein
MSSAYRVARWEEIYEKNRTREMVRMQWVAVPVNLAGDGYTNTMERADGTKREDGSAWYGTFVALLLVAAECHPRGTLIRSNGIPHDAASLSRKTRIPIGIMDASLNWFASKELGWLEVVELGEGAGRVRDGCGETALHNSTVQDSTEAIAEPETPPEEPEPEKPKRGRKVRHADRVLLAPDEYSRLVNAHGEWFIGKCIEKLDAWKGAKGKRTKSDYKAILSWVIGAVNEDLNRGRIIRPNGTEKPDAKYGGLGAAV